jgi:hypothetical protein
MYSAPILLMISYIVAFFLWHRVILYVGTKVILP